MNYVYRIKDKIEGSLRNLKKSKTGIWWSGRSRLFRVGLSSALAGVFIGVVSLLVFILASTHHETKPDYTGDTADSTNKPEPSNQPSDKGDLSESKSSGQNRPSRQFPSSIFNLTNWKLTLPVDTAHKGSPDEITQPELAAYDNSLHFKLNGAKDGVIFQAPAGGATTSGSGYPRSELREMTNDGSQPASWSNTAGTHTMTIRQAITHLPSAKPQVVAGQIHDASDDVIMIRLDKSHLYVEANGDSIGTLDSKYKLGNIFTVKIVAQDGHIKVFYNGSQKVDYAKNGSGYYFKAGCYTQSNTSKGDSPGAYGEVVIFDLRVSHT